MKLKQLFLPLLVGATLSACAGKDSICDCIEAGDRLNKTSSEILKKEPTVSDEKAIQKLRRIKKQKCAEFENMSGPEMLERKQTCGK